MDDQRRNNGNRSVAKALISPLFGHDSRGAATFLSIGLLLVLGGCLVLPKTEQDPVPECELWTRSLTLDIDQATFNLRVMNREFNRLAQSDCREPECIALLAPAITVSMGSVIVSGSIVVAGNTLHWIEKQGRCEDSMVRQATRDLAGTFANSGGWVMRKGEDLINWFKAQAQR